MLRLRSNCSTVLELPTALCEVISVTPAMVPRGRSSGVVTLVATVCGLAPGSDADTTMVGISTLGSGATGSRKKATPPASARPHVSNPVANGRRTKGAEMFTAASAQLRRRTLLLPGAGRRLIGVRGPTTALARCGSQAVEEQVNHRRGEQRQHLAHQQSADDRDAQRRAQLRSGAGAQHQRQGGK